MSTSHLYHSFGIRGYNYVRTDYQNGHTIFTIHQKPETCRCSACGSPQVLLRGRVERRFRMVPIGRRATCLVLPIPRVECQACGVVRQVKIPFADTRRSYTSSFERYALELGRRMTIRDVAMHLGVSWDVIKDIQKRDLGRRFAKPKLKHLRNIAEAWQRAAPNSIVENLYGPTELTICCAAYRWNAAQSFNECVNDTVPIGQIYSGLDHIIIDDERRLVSPGDVGELCVAGAQTFPGYWRDPARTCARFFNHTDEEGRARSYYRTGDLVKILDRGDLAFMGRVDHQIKVRGYRIDPGDIEAVLTRQPGVDQAVALGWPLESERAQGIVAFVAVSLEDPTLLHDALRQEVPAYMISNKFHVLPSMPLNSNGKVDRNALRAASGVGSMTSCFVRRGVRAITQLTARSALAVVPCTERMRSLSSSSLGEFSETVIWRPGE